MHFCLRPSSFYIHLTLSSLRAGAKHFAESYKQITARRIQRNQRHKEANVRPSERRASMKHKDERLKARAKLKQKRFDNSLIKHSDATSNRRVTRSSAVKKGLIDLCRDD